MGYKSLHTLADCMKNGAVFQITCGCGRLTWRGPYEFTHPTDRKTAIHSWIEVRDLKRRLRCKGCGRRNPDLQIVIDPPVPKGVPVLPFLQADDRERKRMIRAARG